jgi:hypothetical protein
MRRVLIRAKLQMHGHTRRARKDFTKRAGRSAATAQTFRPIRKSGRVFLRSDAQVN